MKNVPINLIFTPNLIKIFVVKFFIPQKSHTQNLECKHFLELIGTDWIFLSHDFRQQFFHFFRFDLLQFFCTIRNLPWRPIDLG